MGIKPNFGSNDLRKLEESVLKGLTKNTINAYLYIGETLVNHAKESVGFQDQTGNLRSSIGYVLFVNGISYKENYQGKAQGASEGRKLANEIFSRVAKSHLVLVVTAGMNYAYEVETKGYNVLAATENFTKQVVANMLKQLMK